MMQALCSVLKALCSSWVLKLAIAKVLFFNTNHLVASYINTFIDQPGLQESSVRMVANLN